MNHKKTILSLLLLIGAAIQTKGQTRCMASPDPVPILQPDGTTIQVIGRGHIDINYVETVDGFTIVLNKNGIYEYAKQSGNGDLLPSGIRINEVLSRNYDEREYLQSLSRHLRYSPEKVRQLLSNDVLGPIDISKSSDHDHSEDKTISGSFPQKGKRKILLILIQYPDLKSKYAASNFTNLMNQQNYKNIGSFKDFYMKNSFGKLELQTDVFGWYTADSNYKYYANSEGKGRTRQLVANAIDSAEKSGVDFSKYDNDKDGQVDGVMIIHSGPGAEEGSQNQYIWSHRWSLGGSTARKYDGVNIENYAINPETRSGGSRMVGIGVLCHEFGHLLGLPDLYDVNYQSEGIGNWSLMAGGCWLDNENTPANDDAWSRIVMGWINPIVLDEAGYYLLKPSSTDSIVYKVTTPVKHEYFLLENRQLKGFDKKLDGKGLAIWHINDSILNKTLGNNLVNADEKMKGVDLEEADGLEGLNNLNNRGDAGDLFPGSKNNSSFDDDALPSARTYNERISGIRVFGITILPDSSVKFGFGALPQASFTTSSQYICQNQSINLVNKSKFSSSYIWNFGDGSPTDTSFSPSHLFTKPGEFYVRLAAYEKGNITLDSVKVTVHPAAKADFDWTVNGKVVSFYNKSLNAKSYFWHWGDGKVGYNTLPTFNRTYSDTGSFNVKLIVIGAGNCNDTIIRTIILQSSTTGFANAFKELDMSVYPNPAGDHGFLQFTSQKSYPVKIDIINTLGQQIGHSISLNSIPGTNKIPISLAQARPGIYFVKFYLDGQFFSIPFAKKY